VKIPLSLLVALLALFALDGCSGSNTPVLPIGSEQAAAAKANVRAAIPAAEQLNVNEGSYAGMTAAALRLIAPGLGAPVKAVGFNGGAGYCIEDSEDGGTATYDYVGGSPGAALQAGYAVATIQSGTCLQAVAATAG
jgi:hypothetical protein